MSYERRVYRAPSGQWSWEITKDGQGIVGGAGYEDEFEAQTDADAELAHLEAREQPACGLCGSNNVASSSAPNCVECADCGHVTQHQATDKESLPVEAAPGGNFADVVQRAVDAMAYSHNFATAKPDILPTEKEHILGLCNVIRTLLDHVKPAACEEVAEAHDDLNEIEDCARTTPCLIPVTRYERLRRFIAQCGVAMSHAQEAQGSKHDMAEQLAHVLHDWNELVKAIGSPTNSGALGHARAVAQDAARWRELVQAVGNEQIDAFIEKFGACNAITDIAAERQRQISAEGWTPEHDATHIDGSLAKAAACYALCAGVGTASAQGVETHYSFVSEYRRAGMPDIWPWAPEWWKPKDPRRDLVRAGALIAAEIDRLDRAAGAAEARS